ncbi:MAG: uracil-DNA glycosylase family protein [Thalassobaculum sp.]|uniref:uracil-DNA glycosylase family protein n=1 Tax=Thalassobaculum sp. TaxID=2022740 RepID=UPI0032EFBACD
MARVSLDDLLTRIRACRHCAAHLPLGPRPVLVVRPTARILIVGQAPGTKVHESGIPWNDRSGDRLREWMGIDRETFYDADRIAIVPMGFCYPGVLANGGDAPPRPECAPLWHDPVLQHLPNVDLVILAGMYAQARYLGKARRKTLTETVAAWRDYGPRYLPLPHPSWRSMNIERRNPWLRAELIPELQARVAALLGSAGPAGDGG